MHRTMHYVLALLLTLAALPGCVRKAAPPPEAPANLPGAEVGRAAGKRIAVVPKGMVHDFWLTVKAGAEDAAKQEGATVLWKGPSAETDIAGQIAILEDFINQKVDAIVMAACDAKGLVPTVKKAREAGIPVVAIDSGIEDESLIASFVATDNPKGAAAAARELARLIGEKGTVGVIPFVAGAATSTMREQGFKNEIAKYPGIDKKIPTLYSQSDVAKGMQAAEDMLTAHPNLAGIFAANEPGAMGAAKALEQRGLAGKVKLVAFDASPAQIAALKSGTIQALVVQNPYRMGYEGVMTAIKVLNGESVPKRIDTGVTVVTRENMDDPEIRRVLFPLEGRNP